MVVAELMNEKFDVITCINYSDYEDGTFKHELLTRFDEIVYADFSPDEKSLDIIKANQIKTTIYDHHESFYEDVWNNDLSLKDSSFITYWYDKNRCGTKIMFDQLKGKRSLHSLIEFVELVNTYDLWEWNTELFEEAVNLNRLLWKYFYWDGSGYSKYKKIIKVFVDKIKNNSSFLYDRGEKAYIAKTLAGEKKTLQEANKKLLIRTDEKGNKFGITRLSRKVSYTLFKILTQRRDLEYIIGINEYELKTTGQLKISVRSLDKFNCLDLQYTKGHRSACGADGITNEFVEKLWRGKEVYELGYK